MFLLFSNHTSKLSYWRRSLPKLWNYPLTKVKELLKSQIYIFHIYIIYMLRNHTVTILVETPSRFDLSRKRMERIGRRSNLHKCILQIRNNFNCYCICTNTYIRSQNQQTAQLFPLLPIYLVIATLYIRAQNNQW